VTQAADPKINKSHKKTPVIGTRIFYYSDFRPLIMYVRTKFDSSLISKSDQLTYLAVETAVPEEY